jgi:hypothetical protein
MSQQVRNEYFKVMSFCVPGLAVLPVQFRYPKELDRTELPRPLTTFT